MDALLAHLDRVDPGAVRGVYLYGSATVGGLRPGSDLDLLLITARSLTTDERRDLVEVLLAESGWRGHADTFPEVADRRPIELTSTVCGADRIDFQFGEWLRADLVAGWLLPPTDDPDLVILRATALASHRVLRGAPLETLLDPVSPAELRAAVRAVVPDLVAGIDGDECNALLALARVIVTLDTGEIVPKDIAAERVAATLPQADQSLLRAARRAYLTGEGPTWAPTGAADLVRRLAATVAP